jgi:hypothetical protein
MALGRNMSHGSNHGKYIVECRIKPARRAAGNPAITCLFGGLFENQIPYRDEPRPVVRKITEGE